MKKLTYLLILGICCMRLSLSAQEQLTRYGKIAQEESLQPIRPGIPGKSPFWNEKAHQFIWAPAFNYQTIPGADHYRFKIKSGDGQTFSFTDKLPNAALSPVWKNMPTDTFSLAVIAENSSNDSIGLAGAGSYYKAAFFNGPYHKPVLPYDESAKLALSNLLKKDYVQFWLRHGTPDTAYPLYRYPAKIYSALVVGAVTHAKLNKGTDQEKRSIELGRAVADYMLKISYPKDSKWPYFVPTYYGDRIKNKPAGSHINLENNFTIMGADAGNAFLDLYDITRDNKYLDAAKRIAQTYLKTQLPEGSWYQYVNYKTGLPSAPNIVIPTAVINYFDRLRNNYTMPGLDQATQKALDWVMDNPVRTFNWQAQFEDVKATPPYKRHSREQACDLAIYLFNHKENIPLAEELLRFAEDQFVIWEKPLPITVNDTPDKEVTPGWNSKNWITPSVQEQYGFFMPVARTAGIQINAYMAAHRATGKTIYLEKAKSIANAFTLVQKEHDGDYTTMFTKYDMNFWLNSVVYPAKTMMQLQAMLR